MTAKTLKRFYDLEQKKYIEEGDEITADEKRIQKLISRGLVEKIDDYTPSYSARGRKGGISDASTD